MDLLLVLFMLLVSPANLVFNQLRQLVAEAAAYSPHPELLSYNPSTLSSKGNEFVLGFIGNTDNAPVNTSTVTAALLMTTDDPGIVDFTVEYFGTTQSFQARSGSTTLVNLPVGKPGEIGDIRVAHEGERNKGVHVRTTDPTKLLTIYGINDADVSTDAFLALPCHSYPNVAYKYFVLSANTESTTGTFQSRFLVVGCEDATTVTIRPTQQITLSTDLTGAPVPINISPDPTQPMNSGSFTINQLQTAQFSSPDDLTGTIIESDKPISVFVGHECGQVPDTATACDYLVEQIPPSATWGTQFFTIPLDVRESGEHYRIGTVTDDNQVTVTCTTEGQTTPHLQIMETIHSQRNLQQYVEFDTIGDDTDGITESYRRDFCCIETTKPAIVMMYSKGHSIDEITLVGVNGTQGDPFMLLIPPVSQYSNDYTVTTAKHVRTDFVIHIGIALAVQFFDNSTIDRSVVEINGTTFNPRLRGSDYTPIYCSNGQICVYGAYSKLPAGSHEVRYDMAGAGMNLFVYGFQLEASFAYPAGFEMQAIGVPQISIFNITVLENVGTVRIPINRTGGDLSLTSIIRAFSRNVIAIEGQDYRRLPDQNAANPGFRVRWEGDESEPRYITNPNVNRDPIFEVEIIDDDIPELEPPGGEYFEIDLSLNPTGNGRNGYFFPNAVGRVTIIDNDGLPQIGFQPESYTVDEAAGVVRLTITTNEPGRFTDGTGALFFTEDGTATGGGVDFTGYTRATAIPITFPAGSTETTIEVQINNDQFVETTAQFIGRIVSGGGIGNLNIFAPRATINITDNDRLIFGFEQTAYNFSESVGTGNLGVHLNPDSGLLSENLVFTFSTADNIESNTAVAPGDYTSVSLEYTFMPGDTRLDVTVTIIDDTDFEGAEQFLGRLTTSTNAIIVLAVTAVTIDDNDPAMYCDAENISTESGITYSWPRTLGGEAASITCPVNSNVLVMRNCSNEALWQTFTEGRCETVNVQLRGLNSSFVNLTNETYVATVSMLPQIIMHTENNKAEQTSEVLSQVATYFNDLADFVNESNVIINMMVVEDVVQVVNSLLQWEPENIMVASSSSLIKSFEIVVSTSAQQLTLNEKRNFTSPSLTLVTELNSVDSFAQTGRSFSIDENEVKIASGGYMHPGHLVEDGQRAPQLDAFIGLPASLFGRIDDRPNVGIFFAYYELPIIFPVGGEHTGNLSKKTVVGSQVLAATVGPSASLNFQNLDEPITIILRPKVTEGSFIEQGTQMCASWDFTLQDWITDGCTTIVGEDGIVTCNCDHLTNFAILVDICLRKEDCEHSRVDQALTYISYIGITISIICLACTILTLLVFKKIREKDISKYHLQLSFALLLMFVLTLILVAFSAENVTTIYGGCVSLSFLVHYFTLVAVMWMGAEALLMFQKLVIVFVRITAKFIVFVSIVCWTIPIIFVIVPFIMDLANGHDQINDIIVQRAAMKGDISYCFLSQIGALIGAFLTPIFLILVINVIVFIWVITVVIRRARKKAARTGKALSNKQVVRMTVGISGVLFLFGLSWLFFVFIFSHPDLRETFQILFTVLNSLQGFFIFAFILFTEGFDYWKALLSCKPKHPSHETSVLKGKQITDLNILSKQEKSTSGISPNVLTTEMDAKTFMY